MPPKFHLTDKGCEEVAVQSLQFLVAHPEHLGEFFNETGLTPETLRQAMQEDHFLRSVLQYYMSNESLLIRFSEQKQLPPASIIDAARRLGCHFEN